MQEVKFPTDVTTAEIVRLVRSKSIYDQCQGIGITRCQ